MQGLGRQRKSCFDLEGRSKLYSFKDRFQMTRSQNDQVHVLKMNGFVHPSKVHSANTR